MPYLLALRTKMGTQISAWRLGGFDGDHIGHVVSIRHGEGSNSQELERISYVEYERRGFDQIFLQHWRDQSGLIPFTILKKRRGCYYPDVLSFVPAGRDVAKITGRNGRYNVKYI